MSGDIELGDVGFKPLADKDDVDNESGSSEISVMSVLTKEDLLEIEKAEKIWFKIRIAILVFFWIIWVAMLIAVIVILLFSPSCPVRENLNYWETGCMYRVNPFAFSDSDKDSVGDFKGIDQKIEYLTTKLNVKTIIIDPFLEGVYGTYRFIASDFNSTQNILGSKDQLKSLIRGWHKSGINVVLTFDIGHVSTTHPFFKNNEFIENNVEGDWVGRNGEASKCEFSGNFYYSSMGSVGGKCESVDLKLTSNATIQEVASILRHWLTYVGADGILLTNVAFYHKGNSESSNSFKSGNGANNFFKFDQKGQVFSSELDSIISNIKKYVFDPVNEISSRKKFLMIESGDIGTNSKLGDTHPIIRYLNQSVDMVLLPEFHRQRGFKYNATGMKDIDINNYFDVYSSYKRKIGLSTASIWDLRHNDLQAVVGSMLTPGVCVIYMGSELGMSIMDADIDVRSEKATNKGFSFFPNSSRALSDKNIFLNDAMFPWELSMFDEDKNYLEAFETQHSVQLQSAVGAPQNIYTLFKVLSELQNKESLQWGNMSWIIKPNTKDSLTTFAFKRLAEGFSPIIVVYVKNTDTNLQKGFPISLSSVCNEAKLVIDYPYDTKLSGQEINMENVYIRTSSVESLYVFLCKS